MLLLEASDFQVIIIILLNHYQGHYDDYHNNDDFAEYGDVKAYDDDIDDFQARDLCQRPFIRSGAVARTSGVYQHIDLFSFSHVYIILIHHNHPHNHFDDHNHDDNHDHNPDDHDDIG